MKHETTPETPTLRNPGTPMASGTPTTEDPPLSHEEADERVTPAGRRTRLLLFVVALLIPLSVAVVALVAAANAS